MTSSTREVYVISDLHIGGQHPDSNVPGDRGFRICTHVDTLARFVHGLATRKVSGVDVELVINGDFIDFLAEKSENDDKFVPFVDNPEEAVRRFVRITDRDKCLFDELRRFIATGAHLTILLGNHDIELSFPKVRRQLATLLDVDAFARLTFLYDGEAYVVGNALIEHGNRYDGFNVIDHDALRRARSLQSRSQINDAYSFEPPPGSRVVSEVMNPIKKDYPFVDLLKPETEAVLPILLALEPSYRKHVAGLRNFKKMAERHAPIAPAEPAYGGDIAASGTGSETYASDIGMSGPGMDSGSLATMLGEMMAPDAVSRFISAIEDNEESGDIASYDTTHILGLARLLAGRSSEEVEKRLPALLEALKVLREDRSFDDSVETVPAYLSAARELAGRGFQYVIFGHTHLAKCVALGNDCTYLNTGTWADLICFPQSIVRSGNPNALEELRTFVYALRDRNFDKYIIFRPTYVRLEICGERVEKAELMTFE